MRVAPSGLLLRGVKRCSRCQVTTTDQLTGERGEGGGEGGAAAEPLATLAAFRASKRGAAEGVFFGMNVLTAGSWLGRSVTVGDGLEVQARRKGVGPL